MNSVPKILLWNKLEDKNYQEKYENKVATIFQSTYYLDLNITSVEILEQTMEDIVLKLSEAASAIVPSRKPKPYLKIYWNASLKSLIKNVRECRRAWIADGRPRNVENELFVNYKQAKKEFRKAQRRAIYEEETKSFQRLEEQYDVDRSMFMKRVSRQRKERDFPNQLTLEVGGRLIEDEDELLEVRKQHYEDLYTPKNEPFYDDNIKSYVEQELHDYAKESFYHTDPLDKPFIVSEVATICKNLPNGKAGGLDHITYKDIKYGGVALHTILTKIFNAVSNLEHVVENWVVESIVSLYKGKKSTP